MPTDDNQKEEKKKTEENDQATENTKTTDASADAKIETDNTDTKHTASEPERPAESDTDVSSKDTTTPATPAKDVGISDEVADVEITAEEVSEKDMKLPKPEGVKKFISKSEDGAEFWAPKTRLGRMVKDGQITNMKDALATNLPVREPEIIDILLPELDDEVLDVNMVQRMTDSGRRVRFSIMTVVGNGNGYVGLGSSKGKEVGPAIRKAIDNAKLNIIEIRRGCGSWECGCGNPHTLPFTVDGKSGSTKVVFRPAPRGVGLAVGDVAKHVLRLSGIEDAWGFTRGETRTTINYAKAVFTALQNTAKLKTTDKQIKELNIISGPVEIDEPLSELSESMENPEEPVS